ncbi:HAD family hydrolase [Metallosphaera hakonensis]|uniref:HAD family hydrolase n=1 Tax=Metallosphaera hakonensis JCM 8857 = DSM 7519 TaxID=1293036 RepID=A0A2U9ISG2_9CREN|nr:HAD family phosphatase [Metallosphaera hakonensis]AWR98944.1 HAD-IA family hydrolase [Metallosphaera hakonensis JCM 8857 = DSM 7519]
MKVMILDLDGTLATTANVHKEAWEIALKELGIPVEVDLDLLMGRRTMDIAKILAKDRYLELFELKNRIYDELVPKKARPLPCAKEMVEAAKSKGYSIAVVTSSLRRSAKRSLEVTGITPDLLIAGDDVERGKPDPYPVLLALNILKGEKYMSVGVGDTQNDFQAFKSAGLGKIFIIKGELNLDLEDLAKRGAIIVRTPCDVMQELGL